MTNLKVVSIRDAPPLTDIVGMLRRVADEIENNTISIKPDYAHLVLLIADEPVQFGYGQAMDRRAVIGLLEECKHQFVQHEVAHVS